MLYILPYPPFEGFYFGGLLVCTEFLRKGGRLSPDVQSMVPTKNYNHWGTWIELSLSMLVPQGFDKPISSCPYVIVSFLESLAQSSKGMSPSWSESTSFLENRPLKTKSRKTWRNCALMAHLQNGTWRKYVKVGFHPFRRGKFIDSQHAPRVKS